MLLLSKESYEAGKTYLKGLFPAKKQMRVENNPQPKAMKFTLDSVAVHPDARGLKAGQALVRVFERAAETQETQGAAYLALGVEYDNLIARKFYEHCGWHLVKEDPTQNQVSYQKEIR